MVRHILHANSPLQLPVLYTLLSVLLGKSLNSHQITINKLHGRQGVEHVGSVLIDPSHTRHKPHSRHRENRKLGDKVNHISLTEQQLYDYGAQKSHHGDGLHRILRQNRNSPGNPKPSGILFPVFPIFVSEIILPLQNLNFLNPAERLIHPLKNFTLIILVLHSEAAAVLSADHQKTAHKNCKKAQNNDRDGLADHQQINHQHPGDGKLCAQLQRIKDHLHKPRRILVKTSLQNRDVIVQVKGVRLLHVCGKKPR